MFGGPRASNGLGGGYGGCCPVGDLDRPALSSDRTSSGGNGGIGGGAPRCCDADGWRGSISCLAMTGGSCAKTLFNTEKNSLRLDL